MQQFWKIAKVMMLDLACGSIENHQPGAVSWLRRPLSDPIGRKLVIEVGGAQALLVEEANDQIQYQGQEQTDNQHGG